LFYARCAADAARAGVRFVTFGGFMFAHPIARSLERIGRRSTSQFILPALALLLSAFVATGCTSAPPAPIAGPNPANASAATPPVAYRSVIGPYTSNRPRDPSEWGEQNQRITPSEKR
jgi:hypothetical protein